MTFSPETLELFGNLLAQANISAALPTEEFEKTASILLTAKRELDEARRGGA